MTTEEQSANKKPQTPPSSASTEATLVNCFNALIQFLDGKTTKTEIVNQLESIHTPDVAKVVNAINQLDQSVTANKIDLSPLRDDIQALADEVKVIPDSYPEAPTDMSINNFPELEKSFDKLAETINNLTLVAEAPQVKVNVPEVRVPEIKVPDVKIPAPIVTVEPPDLDPIKDLLKDILTRLKKAKLLDLKIDLTTLEDELKKHTKQLKELIDKPIGGGGGGGGPVIVGGGGLPDFVNGVGDPVSVEVETDGSVPVTVVGGGSGSGGLTDAELRATPVDVEGPLTNAELRATPVPVSGNVATGGLTDAQLRATAVPVSTGGLTDAQLRNSAVPVSGPLTDAQLRNTPVPVSGSVTTGALTDAQLRASAVPVSGTVTTGGLTDAQLRNTPVPVSGTVTSSPAKATDSYAISNIEKASTYAYFGFEDAAGAWYIMRKTIATKAFEYTKGASAYTTAWTNRASQTYASYGTTF